MIQPSLYELRLVLEKAGLMNKATPLWRRFRVATCLKEVRDILDIKIPIATDLSSVLRISGRGTVLAVRWDLTPDVNNHKKIVVAGLILRGVLLGTIPHKKIDTLIDAGGFNSASALKYYAERFGMRGIYIMSRLFPKDVTDILESDIFKIIRAPFKYHFAREREFYEYLIGLMRLHEFRQNKYCLWHGKYGGLVAYPFGCEIARRIVAPIDCTVSCLGAGSTLEGLQIPIQDELSARPIILIAEHEKSPLFVKANFRVEYVSRGVIPSHLANPKRYRQLPNKIPHLVINVHFDEINQMLRKTSTGRIAGVVQFSDTDWQATQAYLLEKRLAVGNTSAANVSVAWRLAAVGYRVLTVIFEPWRKFYGKTET